MNPMPMMEGRLAMVHAFEPPCRSERSLGPRAESLQRLLDRALQQDSQCEVLERELQERLRELQSRRAGLRRVISVVKIDLSIASGQHAQIPELQQSRPNGVNGSSSSPTHRGSAATASTAPASSSWLSRLARSPSAAAIPPRAHVEIAVGRPVGLPNRGNDCFWLAAIQCLRHTPNFPGIFSGTLHMDRPAENLLQATSKLLYSMQLSEPEGQLQSDGEALTEFRHHANEALPASDGCRKLVQPETSAQMQQDTHEFLSQLLDHLGTVHHSATSGKAPSPRPSLDRVRVTQIEEELHKINRFIQQSPNERDKQVARQNMKNLCYEYSTMQWAASTTRMASSRLGAIFEGQRLASMHCKGCGRRGISGAEPFSIEEVKLGAMAQDSSWLLSRLSGLFGTTPTRVGLAELLKEGAEIPAAEGYLCPNSKCNAVGSSARQIRYLRLPSTLVLHVNRAQPDGSRCTVSLEFQDTIDLRDLGLVTHWTADAQSAFDYNWEPCSTSYVLFGAVFHRGPTATSGHYFAYVLFGGVWVMVNDNRVQQQFGETRGTPMSLEVNTPEDGPRVALLFYRRKYQNNDAKSV